MNKNELRKIMIEERRKIINKKELSTIIVDKILELEIYKKSKVIALYKSMDSEVDTSGLINKSLKDKTVLLPKIVNKKMIFIKINSETDYEKSDFGVFEPMGKIYDGNIDLIIVPGVSFDSKLNRLGFGMGYYDKYLVNSNIYKIGICFSKQIVDNVPVNELDIKMDMVITEDRVY